MDLYTPGLTTGIQQSEDDPFTGAMEMKGIRQKLIFEVSSDANDSVLDQLHSSTQPVTVYLRIRPKSAIEVQLNDPDCLHVVSKTSLCAIAPSHCKILKNSGKGPSEQSKLFYFSRIYSEDSTQTDIFHECVLPVLEDFFDGQNCLIFSYGVTNSGKSYTITGTGKQPGVLPRTLDVVFNSIKECQFDSHSIKPKFFAEASYLTEEEEESDKALKSSLLNQAIHFRQSMSCDHQDESCDQPVASSTSTLHHPDVSTITEEATRDIGPHPHPPLDMSDATSDVSSNISKITFEAGSIGASMFEDLTVHEDHVIDVDTQDGSLGFSLWVSFAEIYNEFIFDLLGDEFSNKPRPCLKLSDDRHGNTYIKGLREVKINSTDEALQLLQLGLRHRHIAGTRLNYQSSRSHSVFTIKIVRIVKKGRRPRVARVNRISIVDLAGSERSKKTGVTGDRSKEAGSINNSLHVLGRCIGVLRQNQKTAKKTMVPYRESKLTHLLHTYFVGKGRNAREGRVVMILNVSNNASVFNETTHVLNFSALASKVKPLHDPILKKLNLRVPILSPMKPIEEEDEENGEAKEETIVENDSMLDEILAPVGGPCKDCEEYKRQKEILRNEVVDLKLELWEQETKIRQEVTQEFNKQMVAIQDQANAELEEQEAIMEEEIQKRMMVFQRSTKKHYSRKRRRPGDDEQERQEQFEEIDNLHRINRQLKQEMKELYKELEMEKNKNSYELKELTVSYETKMTLLRCQYNEAILASQDLKKTNEQLKLEISSNNEEFEEIKLHYGDLEEREKKLKEELNARMDSMRKMDQELVENREKVSELESNLMSLDKAVKQLTQQKNESKREQEMASERDRQKIAQLEKEVIDLMDENGSLRKEVYLNNDSWLKDTDSSRVQELEGVIRKMKKERDNLLEDNAQQLEEVQKAAVIKMDDGLQKVQEENDQEREELLLQLVSLEASLNNEKKKRVSLENELKRRELENEIQIDDMQCTLTNKMAALHMRIEDKMDQAIDSALRPVLNTIHIINEKITLPEKNLHRLRTLVCNLKQHEKELTLCIEKQEKEMIKLSIERDEREQAMERRYQDQNTELLKITERWEELNQMKELDEKRQGSEVINMRLEEKKGKLEEKIKQLEEVEKVQEESVNRLKKLSKSLEETTLGMQKENKELRKENKELRKENNGLEETKLELLDVEKGLKEKVTELEEQISKIKASKMELKEEIEQLEGEKKQQEKNVKRLKELSKGLEENSLEMQRKNEELQKKNEEMREKNNELIEENKGLKKMKSELHLKKGVEHKAIELEEENSEMAMELEEHKKGLKALNRALAERTMEKLNATTFSQKSNFEGNSEDEHIYDSVHESFIIEQKNDTFDDTFASRKLPTLERSSQLLEECSDDDFQTPVSRTIRYDMTKDAKKSTKKIKKVKQDVSTPVTNQTPPTKRYNFRSRKKTDNKENASPSLKSRLTPSTLPKMFGTKTSKSKAGRTTTKKKNRLRKSQISGPLELEPESPIETTRRREKLKMNTLEPCNYMPDLN